LLKMGLQIGGDAERNRDSERQKELWIWHKISVIKYHIHSYVLWFILSEALCVDFFSIIS